MDVHSSVFSVTFILLSRGKQILRSISVMILLVIVTGAHGKDLAAKNTAKAQDSVHKLVHKLADKLFDQALNLWSRRHVHLDDTFFVVFAEFSLRRVVRTVHCIYGFFPPQNPGQHPSQKSGQKPDQHFPKK